jgi:hypothetical protein
MVFALEMPEEVQTPEDKENSKQWRSWVCLHSSSCDLKQDSYQKTILAALTQLKILLYYRRIFLLLTP